MKIKWMHPTESGLCDRLVDFLYLIAYARIKRSTLVAEWMTFKAKDIDTAHRKLDILLENVQAHITLPPDVIFDSNNKIKYDSTFNNGIGGGINYRSFYNAYLHQTCTYEDYENAIKTVARDFKFCPAIVDFLRGIPDKFVAFHIRRGDKVRDGAQNDGCFINTSELDLLNDLTIKAIDYYLAAGYTTFFVCGDQDEKKKPFTDYIESKGATTFTIPEMEKWKSTFYDIAVMTKSDFNIASQRYSNFSRFPALIGKGQWRTVFGFEI